MFPAVVGEVESTLEHLEIPDEEREEMKYTVAQSKKSVEAWKAHLLRSVNQDEARLDILDTLDVGSVLVVLDWDMKFLPRKYRESQADWFGKRGISWHVSVAMTKSDSQIQMLTLVHIFQSCNQDSLTVLAIMDDVLKQLKSTVPEIKSICFRQDNAGCYHSASTLVGVQQLAEKHKVQIRVDFSDPQGGKGSCDRKSATIKNHMRVFLNSGHDIETAEQMKTSMESFGGVPGVRVVLCGPLDNVKTAPVKWEGISLVNNIIYLEQGMKVWRAYGIGPGKFVPWTAFDVSKRPSASNLKVIEDATHPKATFCPIKARRQSKEQSETTSETESAIESSPEESSSTGGDDALFACPEEGCMKTYQRYFSLQNHLDAGKHNYVLERETLLDKAMMRYASNLEHGASSIDNVVEDRLPSESLSGEPTLTMGWALKSTTTRKHRLTDHQKRHLTDVFLIGEQTGRKADPSEVSRSMRRARNSDGSFLFQTADYLTPKQITSYFSRLSAKKSVSSPPDIDDDAQTLPDIGERNIEQLREEVMSEIAIQHPIMYDTYSICDLVANSKLSKFAIPMLHDICSHFELDIPTVKYKRKKPYIELLVSLVNSCTCTS